MKPGLKRIEATLDQLGVQNSAGHSANSRPSDTNHFNSVSRDAIPSMPSTQIKSKVSIEPFPLPKDTTDTTLSAQVSTGAAFKDQPPEPASSNLPRQDAANATATVQPFPAQTMGVNMPALPRSKSPSLSSHRHAANPNLAIGLLKEIEILVKGWQTELEHIVQQIQAIYEEGPIVDGWLESYPPDGQPSTQPASVSMLRYAEIDHLMELVEQICKTEPAPISEAMRRTNYRLCGLDSDGRMWSRSCPSEQVPYVSLAIARYQKLRTLFAKKQSLENRLTNLVETLTMLHGQIR